MLKLINDYHFVNGTILRPLGLIPGSKTHFDIDRNELIEYKNTTGYTLSDYLSDLNDINSYNMFTNSIKKLAR